MTSNHSVAACFGFTEEHEPDGRKEADDVVGYHLKGIKDRV